MKTMIFNSIFSDSMPKFVDIKRAGAAAYEQGAKSLAKFDRFATEQALKEPVINDDIAKEYRYSMTGLTARTRYNHMCVLRQFSAFHHLYYPQSDVLIELGIRKQQQFRFTVLNNSDVAELMRATDSLTSSRNYARAIKCLIGLLYCTGLRISEALALNIEDFDTNKATLFVRCGKFQKQRYVPLETSTQTAICDYLKSRHLPSRVEANTPLIADKVNRRLNYNQVYGAFNCLLDCSSVRANYGRVRLHDLRHSFASNILRQIVQAGGDVYEFLPKLATFMGHVSFSSSQIYLHIDPGCLAIASDRFHDAFFNPTHA